MERQLFEAKSEQAKATAAAEQQPVEQPVEGGAEAPVGAVTTEPSTEEGAVAEEVQAEEKTDQQKEIERLEGLLAQDTQSQQQTGKGILASRPAIENRLASLKEEEKMTEKEDKRDEKESKREEKEYEDNKKALKKVDPTMTERQADLATALFQQGMDAKKAIEEAKKKISLDERAAKMKEVSERVLSERKSRIAKEMGATAKSLQNFFKNAGMKVEFVKRSEDFERDYAESGATKTTEGMFIAKDGTIVFNQEKLEDLWDNFGKNIMFHEAIHPVMNIVRNTDQKLYSSIVNGLKNEISRNEGIKKAWDFANQAQYTSRGEEVVEDEFIVESLAMIADGKIKLSTLPSQKRNFLIKALSKLGQKFGIKGPSENADDEELRKFAKKLHRALTKGGLLENIVGEENLTKYEKNIGSLKTLSSPLNEPTTLAQQSDRSEIYGDKIKYKQGGYDLSFVKKEDLVDIEKLIKQIADEKAVVWFWTADQLGRGMYSDETIEGEHYLDAGPSYALDPENKKIGVIWASGADEKTLMNRIEASDYIFIISGSPQQSKLFNKAVIDFLRKRTEKASGLSWNDFTKKVMELTTKTTQKGDVKKTEITKLLEKYNSFEELISAEGNDRKKLFVEMEKNRITTNSPLSQYLKSIGLSFDVDTLRDGFYKENGFDINDVMLVLKPTGLGGTSKHGTYKNDIKGEVVGIPDKRVNGIDLLPEERRKKYSEAQRKAPMTGAAGSLTSELGQASQGGRKLPENIKIVNGWYSPIEKKLRETNAEKQSAQKWLTSGIIGKGDEAIYTGVKGWLESKKPTDQVSKQEIIDWMDNNRVEIEEISKSDEPKMSDAEARNVFENQGYDVVTDSNGDTYVEKDEELYDYEDMSPLEQGAFDVLTRKNLDTGRQKQTKYQTYQLEGEKSNYKELLVTLPSKSSQDYKIVKGKDGKYRIKNPDGSINQGRYWSVRSAAESALVGDIKRAKTTFQSTHFEEPNILVHLRMNTRTDVDGNKVVLLEELQSDWGQEGKKKGFNKDLKELPSNYKVKKIKLYDSPLGDYRFEVIDDQGELIASGDTEAEAKENALEWLNKKGTPAAPFVTDTNAWTKLGLKMALREAVKQGADKVAWTTGEQQNQRYDLSKQVGSVIYEKNKDGTYNVSATRPEFRETSPENAGANFIFNEYDITPKRIEDVFGKDVAEKIINNEGEFEEISGYRTLTGDNLKVGGKGMKGFYDSIVPNVAQALVKELTGKPSTVGYTTFGTRENVGQSMPVRSTEDIKFYSKKGYEFMKGHRVISKQDAYAIIEEGREVTAVIAPSSEQQSIDITPELKAAVQEGMPQFSEGGRVSNEGPLKEGLTADAGITDLDMSRWMKQNNVTSFSDNPEAVEKFKKDFNVTLSEQTLGQMSEKKAELPKPFKSLMKDVIDSIGNAYDGGMNIDTAIKQNLTSQPWYDSLSDQQKSDLDKVIDGVYGEQIEAQRQKEAEEQGTREPISDETKAKTQQLEELYQTILDGNNKEKKAAVEARDKILADDPKLKYIWKNYRNILKQLQSADNSKIELTKTEACP